MKLKNIIVLLMLTFSLLGFPAKDMASELEIKETPVSELSIDEQINYYATLYGVDNSLIKKIVQCESNYKTTAIGDGGRARGLLQYHQGSFERHEKLLGEDLDYYSSHDQIKLGTWAVANGMGNEWTSYRSIKNGGTYSFYSKLLQKHYTVVCR